MSRNRLELVGKKFERLLVKSREENTPNGQTRWKCVCDCGKETIVVGSALVRGSTKSCGCWNKERIGDMNRTHNGTSGRKSTPTHGSWRGMKERCTNPNNSHYHLYGGRGISFCEDWKSFENFLEDMGERPEGMSLERIDVNGNYCKENCKWEIIGNQNFNISLKSNNTTGRSGLSTRIQKDGVVRWVATIGYNGKSIYLGIFNTYEEAVAARDLAEMTYYGKIKQ